MQNYRYLLLGFLLVFILGGGALYWTTMTPDEKAVQSDSALPVSSAPTVSEPPAEEAQAPSVTTSDKHAASDVSSDKTQPAEAPVTSTDASGTQSDAAEPVVAAASNVVPEFDLLRVEGDGSLVIAGRAMPNADVELIAGSRRLGAAKAGPNGDFAIVLDRALSAGDHQLVLRATGAGSTVSTSSQTAIVSVPSNVDGQVLALVEAPGQASRLITRPEPAPAQPAQKVTDTNPDGAVAAAQPETDKQAAVIVPSANIPLAIEAVEIEGQSVFVAGSAQGAKGQGNTVSVRANDVLLGVSSVSHEKRFLIQSHKPLAVGDYIIRADLLDNVGRIIATARVPFRRVAGENLSAVATETDNQSDEGNHEAPSALQKVDGSVIIRRGDNLWTISKRTYGHGLRYTTIYLANRDQIRNPDLIWPGQVFVMPQEPLHDDEVRRQLNKSADQE